MFFSEQGVIGTTDSRLGGVFGDGVRVLGSQSRVSRRGLYQQNVWVNVSVNLLARGIAKTPLKAYKDGTQGTLDRERLRSRGVDAHPLAALLARPWKGAATFRLLNALVLEYLIEGRVPCWKDRGDSLGGLPRRLIPMRCDQVSTQYKRDGSVGFYEWREKPNAEPVRILPEDVVMIGFEDGMSPLVALARAIEIDLASQRTTTSFYENGAQLGAIITSENKIPGATVEQIEATLRGEHKGPDKAFRTLVLGHIPGAKYFQPTASSADAQTIEHRKLAREEVLAAFHIPQPIGGVLDRATFSNIETQTRMWVVDTLGEHFAMIEAALNGQLVDAEREWDGCFVEFDANEVLRGDPKGRAAAYGQWLNAGVYTPNELRRLENLPPIQDAWADAIHIPANLEPAGLPGGASGTPSNRVRRVAPVEPPRDVPSE